MYKNTLLAVLEKPTLSVGPKSTRKTKKSTVTDIVPAYRRFGLKLKHIKLKCSVD